MDACVSAFTADDQASDTNGLGLATAVWTRFGHDASRAGAFSPREGPWGVWPGNAYGVRTSQNCVKNHGTHLQAARRVL
jgi:purine nucleoside permease